MDRAARKKRDVLERMLLDESVEPTDLPLSLLEYITNNFSDEKQIGKGGFAVVYKGMLRNGTIAVKKLELNTHLHENKFKEEVECLMKAKHKNVVRFLGYCADTQGMMERYNGKVVLAEVPQRLLCFEYLPKGSLHDYITDASHEIEWTQCYQIIKGICAGLHYLHENCIVHLDLKPANILFDDNVVPKIADFGLSRCFDEMQSHVITSKLYGTLGYIAPEVIYCGRITFMSDMYSLGVIINEILSGKKMYLEDYDVLKSWGNRLDKLYREKQLEQLRVCAEIAKECTDYDPKKRPDAQAIVRRLDEVDIIVDRYIIARRPDEADIVNRSIVTNMSNLSVAQEEINKVEEPIDGSQLFGAIGRELSLRRGSASVSVSPRTHKPQYHTIGVSVPLVPSIDPAAAVTRSVRVLGSTTKRSSTTAHSVKGFRMRMSCNGCRVLGLTTKRSSKLHSVKGFRMKMSCCNGCRALRKGCSDNCAIRECLQWIRSPDRQANATVFLAKFYGRAGLLSFITAGPEHLRPAIFRSLLYEACGRIVNPVYGSVGLLWSGNWQLCQAAVESVLQGMPIVQLPPAAMAIGSGIHL